MTEKEQDKQQAHPIIITHDFPELNPKTTLY